MPPPLSADHSAAPPPGRGTVDALISQTRRLRGEVDAVRREAPENGTDPQGRWQRALCDLALHQLNDLDTHLAQLRDGPPSVAASPAAATDGSLLSRVGSAEWNLLTDEASWSAELYQILGRDPSSAALTLDELPSLVYEEDRPLLTAMVTDCLVDGKPIDGEFRVRRPGGKVRTLHMTGEPVLDAEGSTASMWAVLRDVSELRRSQRSVREKGDAIQRRRARTEHRLATELQEAALPPWRESLRLPRPGTGTLDLAVRHLPASTSVPNGGPWYDAFELPDGDTLLGVGDFAGHGVTVASGTAALIGALRGLAMAGAAPGRLLGWLDQLLDASDQPALGSAVCCRYRPATRTLSWASAGHLAPLLFRDGTGCTPTAPEEVLLGTRRPQAAHGQAEETLRGGDLLLLHTDGLVPRHRDTEAVPRLLGLAPRLGQARTAQECVRTIVEESGESGREDDACVLVARLVP